MSQKVLYFCILGVFALLTSICLTYNAESALFPIVCLGIGIVLCILKLLSLFNPKIGQILDAQGLLEGHGRNIASVQENMDGMDEDALEDGIVKSTEEAAQLTMLDRAKREFLLIGWCVMTVAVVWFVGFYLASAVMVFLFIKCIGRRPLKPAASIALAVPVILYLGFSLGLKIRLYAGLLFS